MDNNYFKPLAEILWLAQGRVDAETGERIDVGGEAQKLRNICDRLRVEREVLQKESQRADEAEAESEALREENHRLRRNLMRQTKGLLADIKFRV